MPLLDLSLLLGAVMLGVTWNSRVAAARGRSAIGWGGLTGVAATVGYIVLLVVGAANLDIVEAVSEGESLRIRWMAQEGDDGGEALLIPRTGPDESDWRRAFSTAMASEITKTAGVKASSS